ncbi:hypothetical protein L484_018205 [Morus notabilis]|uniref:Uncharacterized protein n=1 Tax=Morus notabilis TaxID=981085 RepID=W9R1C3_9ROSA|nr:hypothetical protein L484_018205 [Morus notabilis]
MTKVTVSDDIIERQGQEMRGWALFEEKKRIEKAEFDYACYLNTNARFDRLALDLGQSTAAYPPLLDFPPHLT